MDMGMKAAAVIYGSIIVPPKFPTSPSCFQTSITPEPLLCTILNLVFCNKFKILNRQLSVGIYLISLQGRNRTGTCRPTDTVLCFDPGKILLQQKTIPCFQCELFQVASKLVGVGKGSPHTCLPTAFFVHPLQATPEIRQQAEQPLCRTLKLTFYDMLFVAYNNTQL